MSNGPVSGASGIAVTLPTGLNCFWTATTQAAYTIQVVIKDNNNNVVVQCAGSGTNFQQIGSGSFQVNQSSGNYTVFITANGGQNVQVIWDETPLTLGSTIYACNFSFIGEDGADTDYNDIYLSLTWFQFQG